MIQVWKKSFLQGHGYLSELRITHWSVDHDCLERPQKLYWISPGNHNCGFGILQLVIHLGGHKRGQELYLIK